MDNRKCSADFLQLAIADGFVYEAEDFLKNDDGTLFCRFAGECTLRVDGQRNYKADYCARAGHWVLVPRLQEDGSYIVAVEG